MGKGEATFGGFGGTWDMPGCFGNPVCSTLPECSRCSFYGSCSYYLNNPIDEDTRYSTRREKWRKHNSVSLESLGNTLETATAVDPGSIEDESLDKPEFTRRDLMLLLKSLLTDMDVGGLALTVYAMTSNATSNAELAKRLQCTRQNTHKRLLSASREDPRLRALMMAVFFRFGKMVRAFDGKRKIT